MQEEGCFRNYVELGSTCQSSATAQEKEEEPREAENQWETEESHVCRLTEQEGSGKASDRNPGTKPQSLREPESPSP